ncbi:uncharacterized protein Z519_00987 [Cladophialophora bantiana CBS 173.52]|uniref:Uncharacterized protein n=1 Tax=Cladophialophora bantiana (strain ATCC 10958 / CBS 173.52 / CDC B-1940 / NIH 8579) TaxID=1442370 RepID=A0A0D2IRD6_CLAB1|nr:uncharacterized protein Z519_00987 [Cladophialophora bantiana CBS 173.52]KIW99324.1 hypothetical protein Z519_00987 [Cladophialophora bantiana CBS 173.52]
MPSTSSSHLAPPDDKDIDTTSHASNIAFLSLKYAPDKKCICLKQTKFELASSICPQHGYHDSKSKIKKRKSLCVAGGSRKRKESDIQDRDFAPLRRRTTRNATELQRRTSPNSSSIRYLNCANNTATIVARGFIAELCFMNDYLRQILATSSASDPYIRSFQFSECPPLTQIDFLEWPLSARMTIYRYFLVAAKAAVIFPGKRSEETFRQLNKRLDMRILYTNSQVYREARSVLYGENNFIAAEPTDFFRPTGIQGLRASTARKIKHISFLTKGTGAQVSDVGSKALSTSINSTILLCPAFLRLDTLTIRSEVFRPLFVSMYKLQQYAENHGLDGNIMSAYNKTDTVMNAAATVAYKALRRKSPFQGLREVENRFESARVPKKEPCLKHVIEVCLFRSSESTEECRKQSQALRGAILDMLFEEMERDVQGADERFRDFVRRYPE